ncbi:SGNH/GDSL hydrolase family protein, partial [Streptomyces sp. NPDC057676]|uniref:SGNH/GDSL hydrolase family protein n=1 Tax=Streptomyces sp. NPDC057676 TaxID=3346205 RepID=UPI0036B07651
MSMSRARVARRIATAAAYGGGGIGLLGGATVGLLLTEVRLAKRVVGGSGDLPPRADGRYGTAFDRESTAPPLRLAFLGDSTAAGQGVRHAHQTPGALLASGLAAVAERPVELRVVAQPGAQSDDLARQVALLLGTDVPTDVPPAALSDADAAAAPLVTAADPQGATADRTAKDTATTGGAGHGGAGHGAEAGGGPGTGRGPEAGGATTDRAAGGVTAEAGPGSGPGGGPGNGDGAAEAGAAGPGSGGGDAAGGAGGAGAGPAGGAGAGAGG